MKKIFFLTFLIFSFGALSQNLQIGGALGIGSSVDGSTEVEKTDLKEKSFYLFVNLEEDTFLQFRGGTLKTRKENLPKSYDLNYYGLTVTYTFDTPVGNAGFFGGITYYDGKIEMVITQGDNQVVRRIEVGELGAMAGMETFIPLTKRFSIYLDLELHYIPEEGSDFALNFQGGFLIKF